MKLFLTALFLLVMIVASIPTSTSAQIGINRTIQVPGGGRGIMPVKGDSGTTLSIITRNVVTLFFSIGALGFTIMLLWGGVDWILSGGDKEKVSNARKRITSAIIGLLLLSLTFVIIAVISQISGFNILGNLPLKNLSTP